MLVTALIFVDVSGFLSVTASHVLLEAYLCSKNRGNDHQPVNTGLTESLQMGLCLVLELVKVLPMRLASHIRVLAVLLLNQLLANSPGKQWRLAQVLEPLSLTLEMLMEYLPPDISFHYGHLGV